MPRIARAFVAGTCYHVLNRGNGRREVFLKDADYEAFLKAVSHACVEVPMPVLAYCLMPNHFHLVLQPQNDGDLSRWMHWLQNAHVRRYHKHYGKSGHVWQGRFRSFPIEADEHLLAVLRYVERNPRRAKRVRSSAKWRWSSASLWVPDAERPSWLAVGPVPRPADWLAWVDAAMTVGELEAIRRSGTRGAPYGSADWTSAFAKAHGLESTLRPRGRPRKQAKTEDPHDG